MLEVKKIRVDYADAAVAADFTVATGGTVALMGASGAGKSTILNVVAGLLTPAAGEVWFNGKSLRGVKPADRPLTYLLQAHNLFPHLTVRDNIAIGLHPGMKLSAEQHAAVDRALASVSLTGLATRKPATLSGGQQQRAALARCLARDRPLLLLDEPFTALDDDLRRELCALILSLQRHHRLTVLITTHHRPDAEALDAAVVGV